MPRTLMPHVALRKAVVAQGCCCARLLLRKALAQGSCTRLCVRLCEWPCERHPERVYKQMTMYIIIYFFIHIYIHTLKQLYLIIHNYRSSGIAKPQDTRPASPFCPFSSSSSNLKFRGITTAIIIAALRSLPRKRLEMQAAMSGHVAMAALRRTPQR